MPTDDEQRAQELAIRMCNGARCRPSTDEMLTWYAREKIRLEAQNLMLQQTIDFNRMIFIVIGFVMGCMVIAVVKVYF